MTLDYRPRHSIPLKADAGYRCPPRPADWVQLEDSALSVFTDFLIVEPRTVQPEVAIDTALQQMKTEGVRLLLVVDEADAIVGVITTKDIQGERPIQLTQERRVARSSVTVRDIMTPRTSMSVLRMISVQEAKVGHILATLHSLERVHTLVVDYDEATGRQYIRGMFSKRQIEKQMHRRDPEEIAPAHDLAGIVKSVG